MNKRAIERYKQDYKEQVIKMVKEGKRISEISKELDIPKSTITTWVKRKEIENSETEEQKEIKKLLKQLKDVTEERDILKKAINIFSKAPERNIHS